MFDLMPEPVNGTYVLIGEAPNELVYVRDNTAADRDREHEHWFRVDDNDAGSAPETWATLAGRDPVVLYRADDPRIAVIPDANSASRTYGRGGHLSTWTYLEVGGRVVNVRIVDSDGAYNQTLTLDESERFALDLLAMVRNTRAGRVS